MCIYWQSATIFCNANIAIAISYWKQAIGCKGGGDTKERTLESSYLKQSRAMMTIKGHMSAQDRNYQLLDLHACVAYV